MRKVGRGEVLEEGLVVEGELGELVEEGDRCGDGGCVEGGG